MSAFEAELQTRLEAIHKASLLRELRRIDSPQGVRVRIQGRELINFSSNDYLGLTTHPALCEAARKAVAEFGTGSGASRLVCGSLAPHHELEAALSAWKGTAAALIFSTGYAAALGVLTTLLEKQDVVILDKLVHACIVDAARLSGAKIRVFDHNDTNDLESKLQWAVEQVPSSKFQTPKARPRVLVVTESVFSMDGDQAPLREIVALKDRYEAWLMVDEAHATGLFGTRGSGLVEHLGLSGRVEIQMATLGKALGSAGGAICGSRRLADLLVNGARSFIFSTAPTPAASAAARAAVELIQAPEGESLREKLWLRVAQLRGHRILAFEGASGQSGGEESSPASAILPFILGDEGKTMRVAGAFREEGFLVPGIRYPTVARGRARLRVTLSAGHSQEDVVAFQSALNRILQQVS